MIMMSNTGRVTTPNVDPNKFNGVKVFSATMAPDRERLGDRITSWLADRPEVSIVDTIVTQSSDEAFHCVAITIFYDERT